LLAEVSGLAPPCSPPAHRLNYIGRMSPHHLTHKFVQNIAAPKRYLDTPEPSPATPYR
jgi:hypothetical protein